MYYQLSAKSPCPTVQYGVFRFSTNLIFNFLILRYLEICIFEIERNWAFYKQLKLEHDQKKSRKIFHARQKLRRAVKCSKELQTMLSQNDQV